MKFEIKPMYAVAIVGVEHAEMADGGITANGQSFGQWKVTGKESKKRLIALLDEIGERMEDE